jgi:hypothetical protein
MGTVPAVSASEEREVPTTTDVVPYIFGITSDVTLVPVLLVNVPKSGLAFRVKLVTEVIVNMPVLVEYTVATSPLERNAAIAFAS